MTTKEIKQLIKNIFVSELDYLEIKKRWEIEVDPAIKLDYEKKLKHDEEVIGIWLSKLKTEAISNLNITSTLEIRNQILDELLRKEIEENERINEIQKQIKIEMEKISENEMEEERKLREEKIKNSQIDLERRKEWNNKRLEILNELKNLEKTIWQQ